MAGRSTNIHTLTHRHGKGEQKGTSVTFCKRKMIQTIIQEIVTIMNRIMTAVKCFHLKPFVRVLALIKNKKVSKGFFYVTKKTFYITNRRPTDNTDKH